MLDNALDHPAYVDKVQIKLQIHVLYLTPYKTSLLQRMVLYVICTFKAHYMLESFRKMVNVFVTYPDKTVKDYWLSFNIISVIQFIDAT